LRDGGTAALASRTSFVLDPQLRVRATFDYHLKVGRNTKEMLRVIEALKLEDETGAVTPADWRPSHPVIIPDFRPEDEVRSQFGSGSFQPLRYLRMVRNDLRGRRARPATA